MGGVLELYEVLLVDEHFQLLELLASMPNVATTLRLSVINASWLTCLLISDWRNPEEPSTPPNSGPVA